MSRQNSTQAAGDCDSSGMMARWLASGGAVDALAGSDAGMVRMAGARHRATSADQGLQFGDITRGYGCIPPSVDDGLAAGAASHYGCGV
jgi:hypothetical protein